MEGSKTGDESKKNTRLHDSIGEMLKNECPRLPIVKGGPEILFKWLRGQKLTMQFAKFI